MRLSSRKNLGRQVAQSLTAWVVPDQRRWHSADLYRWCSAAPHL